jgi:hypothetical protein
MLPELRRSRGMLPGPQLLCSGVCSGMLCSRRLQQQRLLPCSDLLRPVGSDLLCAFSVQHERVLPRCSELLRSGCPGMLRSGRLCPDELLRQRLHQQRLLQDEEEVLPEPPLRRSQESRLPQEQLPRQRLLPGTELLCSDLCGSWRLQLIE